jgi:hypothetical protein
LECTETTNVVEVALERPRYALNDFYHMFVLGDFIVCPGFKFAAMDMICDRLGEE